MMRYLRTWDWGLSFLSATVMLIIVGGLGCVVLSGETLKTYLIVWVIAWAISVPWCAWEGRRDD